MVIVGLLIYWFKLPTRREMGFESGTNGIFYVLLFIWLSIRICVLSPVAEEFFWRGYVQSTLLKICHPALAVIGQAALFGLVHFRPVLGFVQVCLYGLVFGIWCYRRKTLLPIIIMHIMINSFGFTWGLRDWPELRKIKPTHDYVAEFIELSKPPAYDPNHDARSEYAKAGQLVVEFPDELKEVLHRYPTQWSQEERKHAETWLVSNTSAIELVESGAQKAYYWIEYGYDGKQMLTVFPRNIDKMRHLAFSFCMRAIIRADQGQHEQSFIDVETCFKLGRHLSENKDLLSQLVGTAVRGHALETARMILAHEHIDPVLLTHLQRQFEISAEDEDAGFDFTETRLISLDVIQCIFTDDGQGGGHIPRYFFKRFLLPEGELDYVLSIMSIEEEPDITAWRRLERRSTTAQVKQYYKLLERACSLSPLQYDGNFEGVKKSIEHLAQANPLIRIFSPAISRLVQISAKARVDLDATITILAILRYKADTNQLPDALSQLADTGYIKNIPNDPFSGSNIVYRRTDDSFLLYSFGVDCDDDGGTPSKWGEGEKGGDQVFWPVEGFTGDLESAAKGQP